MSEDQSAIQTQPSLRTGPRSRPTASQWQSARAAYERPDRDITIEQLACNLGVTRNAVYSRSLKEGWTRRIPRSKRIEDQIIESASKEISTHSTALVQTALSTVLPSVCTYAESRVKAHFDQALKLVDTGMERVGDMWGVVSDAASVKELAISLDRLDTIARRTFGLDDSSGSNRRTPSRGATFQPVLDAEVIEEKTPLK